MKKGRILIVDDESSLLESLEMFLAEKGYVVECAINGAEGIYKSKVFNPEMVILDVRLPDMNGIDMIEKIKAKKRNIIIITAFHDMETTIKAIKSGAFEYIPKPIDVEELERAIAKAFKSPCSDMDSVDEKPEYSIFDFEQKKIVGKSSIMKEVFKAIGILSENRVTVLIEGETGTGKELIARAIHYHSPYKNEPFRVINCSAIVGTLLESELFGHEKGSFTGAVCTKRGKLELAGEGTIFLDEVGEIPLELQPKLLRFLQEKEFERIGGDRQIQSKARVIAATNRDLWAMVQKGLLREDLFYRLNVTTIKVPALRERKSDIPLIADYLLKKIAYELRGSPKKIENQAISRMMDYDWPGNVRELENILTHAFVNTRGNVIPGDLIIPLLGKKSHYRQHNIKAEFKDEMTLQEIERGYILKVLESTRWHLGKTCEILGISRPTLRQKIKEYRITEEKKI
ncbi:MAG: sigma-54-dependent Fis family transcriptional regulator [Syntrophorhabdaceae bacterium]|nr:sigma-54-dependent Fis family transcriptional regulator [Syntrophorhabdaceae bacterium]